uniref:DUF4220 domain-containing protein n=1 Tax=Aegilops tauschii TaxID=37682 RepID=R7W2Q2_AEGTA
MRRRRTSCILGAFLWLANLLADSVAVFVLGHLAVRVSGPQHELIAFWAPVLLVHLGGLDTIITLSMQDNELWNRHLLRLVSQVAVAGYVVSKPSWTDKRLLAATVLVFLSGSFKYAVRNCCLYIARPAQIRGASMRIFSDTLTMLKDAAEDVGHAPTLQRTQRDLLRFWNAKFDLMLGKSDKRGFLLEKEIYQDAKEIMSVDAPPNNKESVLLWDDLPNMLEKFQSTSCLHQPYDYVGRNLVKCYEKFYTKMPLLRFFHTLAQYSMVKRYATGDARGMPYVRQWIGKRLIACGVELLDPSMTHTHVTEDLKGFVLNKLVQFGIKKQYNFADFRGQLALQEWRKNGPGTEALYYSINEVKDFPTSILIWHIATDICYYSGSSCTANTECDRSKKKKKLSRELSNYILYLVFKCGVMLTSSSELGHNKVYVEMKNVLRLQQLQMVNPREEAIMKVFEGVEDKQPHSTVNEEQEQPVDTDDTTSGQIKKLLESMADAIYFPILPHASKVAKELMALVQNRAFVTGQYSH